MATAVTLTPQQCKRARALLKWNPQDLASHTRVAVRLIEKFERNQHKLLRPENEELVEAFTDRGVLFHASGEVTLKSHKSSGHSADSYEESVIHIDAAYEITKKTAETQAKELEEQRLSKDKRSSQGS